MRKAKASYELGAGDIGAVVGFKDIKTGDTLCARNIQLFGIYGFSRSCNWNCY